MSVAKYTEPDTKPRVKPKKAKPDRSVYAALGAGVVIGVALAGLIMLGLFGFGALPIIEQQYLPAPACPTSDILLPVCPTQPPMGGGAATPEPHLLVTETVTPSPTLDLAATATVACATFQSEFPATPCP
jgi:hypothetical protein